MCKQAPACRAVLDQASARWPNRNKASDGICASPQHTVRNPNSDHEPRVNGYATAVDLTDDKKNGCDADAWADHLVATRDPRVKYIIRNREIVSSYPTRGYPAWTWRPYSGSNPHTTHTHLSIHPDAIFDRSPWFPEEDTLTPEQDGKLNATHMLATATLKAVERLEQAVKDLTRELAAHRKAG